jgi:hypothetical protein
MREASSADGLQGAPARRVAPFDSRAFALAKRAGTLRRRAGHGVGVGRGEGGGVRVGVGTGPRTFGVTAGFGVGEGVT